MAHSWDSVENSRRSRNEENDRIKSLYQQLPTCYKVGSAGGVAQCTTIDGAAKLPTLRFTVSYALKKTVLLNVLGVDPNQKAIAASDIDQFFAEWRSHHKELLIVFDPSNFYHEQQLVHSGCRSTGRNCDYLTEHEDDLEEAGKLVFLSENCEYFLDGHAPRIISKYESIYELLPKGEAERLAQLIDDMIRSNRSNQDATFLLKFLEGLQPTVPKVNNEAASLEMMTTLRILMPKVAQNDPLLDKPLVAIRCRSVPPVLESDQSNLWFELSFPDLTVMSASEEASRLLGYNVATSNWLDLVHPDSLQYSVESLHTLARETRPSISFAITLACRNIVMTTASMMRDSEGNDPKSLKILCRIIHPRPKRLEELVNITTRKMSSGQASTSTRTDSTVATSRKARRPPKRKAVDEAEAKPSSVSQPQAFPEATYGQEPSSQSGYVVPNPLVPVWYQQPVPYFPPSVLPNPNPYFYFNQVFNGALYYPQESGSLPAGAQFPAPSTFQASPPSSSTSSAALGAPHGPLPPIQSMQVVRESCYETTNSQEPQGSSSTKVYASL